MPYNETIRQLTIEDKNHADVFNAVITKLLENTNYNKDEIQKLEKQLRDVISQFDGYLTTEELIALLEKGIKGDKGDNGIGIQYIWNDTSLGIKRENEEEYSYAQLKGAQGDPGEVTLEQLEAAVSTHDNNATSHKPLRDWVQNLFESLKLTWDSITGKPETFPASAHGHSASEITGLPTSLPASDVYNWAKQSSKPSYSASEVGAIPTSASCNKNWNWSGQAGQPSWLWGGNDPTNMYLYNPINFRVANANTLKDRDLCTEVDGLKSTVVSGKTSVANAINGKLGTSLSNQTSFADMAYYINQILGFDSINTLFNITGSLNYQNNRNLPVTVACQAILISAQTSGHGITWNTDRAIDAMMVYTDFNGYGIRTSKQSLTTASRTSSISKSGSVVIYIFPQRINVTVTACTSSGVVGFE